MTATGVSPSRETYETALAAISAGGLVDQALDVFAAMRRDAPRRGKPPTTRYWRLARRRMMAPVEQARDFPPHGGRGLASRPTRAGALLIDAAARANLPRFAFDAFDAARNAGVDVPLSTYNRLIVVPAATAGAFDVGRRRRRRAPEVGRRSSRDRSSGDTPDDRDASRRHADTPSGARRRARAAGGGARQHAARAPRRRRTRHRVVLGIPRRGGRGGPPPPAPRRRRRCAPRTCRTIARRATRARGHDARARAALERRARRRHEISRPATRARPRSAQTGESVRAADPADVKTRSLPGVRGTAIAAVASRRAHAVARRSYGGGARGPARAAARVDAPGDAGVFDDPRNGRARFPAGRGGRRLSARNKREKPRRRAKAGRREPPSATAAAGRGRCGSAYAREPRAHDARRGCGRHAALLEPPRTSRAAVRPSSGAVCSSPPTAAPGMPPRSHARGGARVTGGERAVRTGGGPARVRGGLTARGRAELGRSPSKFQTLDGPVTSRCTLDARLQASWRRPRKSSARRDAFPDSGAFARPRLRSRHRAKRS